MQASQLAESLSQSGASLLQPAGIARAESSGGVSVACESRKLRVLRQGLLQLVLASPRWVHLSGQDADSFWGALHASMHQDEAQEHICATSHSRYDAQRQARGSPMHPHSTLVPPLSMLEIETPTVLYGVEVEARRGMRLGGIRVPSVDFAGGLFSLAAHGKRMASYFMRECTRARSVLSLDSDWAGGSSAFNQPVQLASPSCVGSLQQWREVALPGRTLSQIS